MGVYDFTVKDGAGKDISLESFKGKVMLIVNTATACGFTPQYEDLEKLHEAYHDKGLEILDFPCNQFGAQAPGTDEEIHQFCQMNYKTRFGQMKKIEVNGEGAHPLFAFLKGRKGFEGFGEGETAAFMENHVGNIDRDYKNNSEIKWNFTKFVVDREGQVIARFEPTAPMDAVEECLSSCL